MRANRSKRPSVMTPWRWVLLVSFSIIVILAGLNVFYRSVQSPVWEEERNIEDQAMQIGSLSSVDSSYHYVWDEPVWVVSGKDHNNDITYVWLKKDESITLRADQGKTKAEIKESFMLNKPDASVEHIKLGLFGGEPVWEVFYERNQAGEETHFYEFYRFRDGSFVVSYKLPTR
ncbi:cell wall elongation regulator TseB-like domain-containing protein [Paenibacillus albus]|uniref:Cell wall elongation regulator TseB-like domain-containing protein n=1 Tax=Paenibacillus albus TaxID=2495582 RepID=A0A3S9A4U9_9BACL|nr:DUF5590 domain-containing protein [Paenibacillus albus]AZN40757.1 hypothetical protein EJC50_14635 [Paenibacillus albus]